MNHSRQCVAKAKRIARVEIHKRRDCGAEKQRINLIKIAVVVLEDFSERLAIIGRGTAGDLWTDLAQTLVVAAEPYRNLGAVQNRIVRPPDRRQIIAGDGRQRGAAEPTLDSAQIKAQFKELV